MTITKAHILEWANGLLSTDYNELGVIPAKAAARLLNAMFNDNFPLTNIAFDDATPTSGLHNCTVVLQLCRHNGFTGSLGPIEWLKQSDFTQMLLLWRWIRQQADSHPIPVGFDFSMGTAPTATNTATVGLEAVSTPVSSSPAPVSLTATTPPPQPGMVPSSSMGVSTPASGMSNVLLSSLGVPAALDDDSNKAANAALGKLLEAPAPVTLQTGPGAPKAPLAKLEPNRLNECPSCGEIVKRMTASNAREVERLTKLHKDLVKATQDKDLNRMMLLLQEVNGPAALPPSHISPE